ncbi:alpha/beta fold hydrolase [Gordonia sp. NPDC003425]
MIGTRPGSGHSALRAGERIDGGSYLDIDGRLVWHFESGDPHGHPTVLVHGAYASAATWGAQISEFADSGLHVFVPERSGHGHSPDRSGPYTFDDMTDQVIGYLDRVIGGPAHLVGWSDGGVVVLRIALLRPDLVRRVVATCSYVNLDGAAPSDFIERAARREPSIVDFVRAGFLESSPDGLTEFDEIYDKTLDLLSSGPHYRVDDFAGVSAPTLVVAADRGVVRLEHATALARVMPRGRLAVLPGTHILPVESPELFNPLVLSFLAADPPSHWEP